MIERPRVALTVDGHIESVDRLNPSRRVVVDRRTGALISSTVRIEESRSATPTYSHEFRWLVRAAREHVSKP